MSQNLMPLEQLAGQVKGHNTVAEKYDQKAEENYKAAGIYLIEARDRIRGGENKEFQTFGAFWFGGCQLEKTRAYEMIAIAEGKTTLEEVRQRSNERKKKHRESSVPERKEGNSLVPQDNPESKRSKDGTRRGGHNKKPDTPEAALRQTLCKIGKGLDREALQDVIAYARSRSARQNAA